MKKDTHPEYRETLFVDSATGYRFVCGSTIKTEKKEVFEGKEYQACYVSVSSASHPFFTGSQQFVDAEKRVDKFMKRYSRVQQKMEGDAQQQQKQKEELESQKKKKKK